MAGTGGIGGNAGEWGKQLRECRRISKRSTYRGRHTSGELSGDGKRDGGGTDTHDAGDAGGELAGVDRIAYNFREFREWARIRMWRLMRNVRRIDG